jgi:HlyD family secretion protein
MADSLLILVSTAQSDRVPGFFRKINSDFPLPVLGELQNSYQTYFAALQTYTQYLGNGYYVAQRQMLRSDLQNINAQEQVIAEQLNLTKLDVSLSGENFNVSETLLQQKVIAPVEYRNEAGKWLGKQMQIPQLKNIQLANTAQRLEKRKQMAALENDIALQRGIFVQALQNWLSAIAAWEQQYLVYASCSGTLVLSSFYNPGRNLQRGEILGSVQPTNSYYFLEATLPQFNFGKLKSGQQALVRFAAYPSEEFGTVAARLDVIKPIPTDSGYLARVLLTAGLVTHLGKELAYREGLQASIEIYTDNRSMLERLLSGLTKAVQR